MSEKSRSTQAAALGTERPTSGRRRKRAGGRAARRAERAAGSEGMSVQPGMKGGSYKPLREADILAKLIPFRLS